MTVNCHISRPRVPILDELRGFDILAMVGYHFAYDLVNFGILDLSFFFSGWMNGIRDAFAGMFIAISGICCLYSRSNLRRGVLCLLAALAVESVTALIPGMSIRFGILHLLGWSMALTGLLENILEKIPNRTGFFAATGCFMVAYLSAPWKINWFSSGEGLFLIGLPGADFHSSDYFPLIPWIFLFGAGYFGGKILIQKGLLQAGAPKFPFLSFCGRHSLWIYLFHQPVLALLIALIQK